MWIVALLGNMLQPFFFLLMLVLYLLSSLAPVNAIAIQKHSAKSSLTEDIEKSSEPRGPNRASSLSQEDSSSASQNKNNVSEQRFQPEKVQDKAGEHACRKVDRMINSVDIGILHPSSFNAYQCVGKCNIKQLQNFNNYARIMATLNRKNKVNSTDGMVTCCVPVKLRPIRLLFWKKQQLILRSFEDMVVEECGCYQTFQ